MVMKNFVMSRVYPMLAVSGICFLLISSCKKSNNDPVPENPIVMTTVQMSGANETPPITTTGTGTAKITYDKNKRTISYDLTWHLGDEASLTTGMHFHGAEDGSDVKNSPVVVPINGFTSASSGTLTGTTRELTPAESAQLLAGKWYINIHSSVNPGGEIRGNIKLTSTTGGTSTGGGGTPGY